ncbi:MAG TPA: signal peptidase I [Clostridiales bacterium]|nr:signal peptidase I [Clostridiales bacterium]
MEDKELLKSEQQEEAAPAEEAVSPAAEESPKQAAPQAEGSTTEEGKPVSKKKRILNGVFLGLQIALVVLSIVICLVVILNPNSQEKVSPVGIKLLPVLTGSMDGNEKDSFAPGALVVATTPKNHGENLKVGEIVTFTQRNEETNEMMLVTHRIVEVVQIDESVYKYKTKGDANALPDEALKLPGDILAVYAFHINGLGAALTWIRDGYHFIFVIIIPLGLLLIYNIYLVAQIVVEGKMKKARAAAAESAKQAALASIDEEEIKRRAIEEYLRNQATAASAAGNPEDKGDAK